VLHFKRNNDEEKMMMNNKALSLMELLVAFFVMALAIGALATIYPGLFTGVTMDTQNLRVWEIARAEIESLKNSDFATLYTQAKPPSLPQANSFSTGSSSISGVYYVEQMFDKNSVLLTDLVRLEVVVCFKVGNRMIGEDKNLNGILDTGEDVDGNKKITSPVRLSTLAMKQ